MVCNFLSDIWKFFSKNQFAYTQKNTKIGGGIKWSKIGGVELPANYFNILLQTLAIAYMYFGFAMLGSIILNLRILQ